MAKGICTPAVADRRDRLRAGGGDRAAPLPRRYRALSRAVKRDRSAAAAVAAGTYMTMTCGCGAGAGAT